MAKILTQRSVDAAQPRAKRYGVRDGLTPGLRLIVHPSGQKTFALFARVNGRLVNTKIGSAAVLNLAAARAKGREVLAGIVEGEDPRVAKRDANKTAADTVAVFARRFIERYVKIKNKTWRDVEQRIAREVLPRWGRRPITSITQADVVALLDAIMDRGAPRSANLTLATVRKMFNWGCERGTLAASPCDRVKAPATDNKRDRVPTDAELALIWQAAEGLGYPFGPFFQVLVLSGQRREQVAGMRWSELDPKRTVWVVPGERTKNGLEHRIPISAAIRSILTDLPRFANSDLVFSSNGKTSISGFSKAKTKLDSAVAILNGGAPIDPWVPHDLRRAIASGMAALGVQLPVVEKILHHLSGSFGGVAGIYQRHSFRDEMAAALDLWGQHVTNLDAPPAAGRRPRKPALVRQGARL